MNVKTFQATDMKNVLRKVKAEMGANAVILNTRKINNSKNSFGIFSRPIIEVTAVLDTEVAEEKESRRDKRHKEREDKRTNSMKRKPSAQEERVNLMEPVVDALTPLREEIAELRNIISASGNANAIGRSELKKAAQLSDELENMKSMFNFMIEQSDLQKGMSLETNYLIAYRRMIERGVEPQHARGLIERVKKEVPGKRDLDLRTIISELVSKIEETMFIGDPIDPYVAGSRVVSLVGPTGVGKTTTIAKIAAELTLKGKKVGLITIDTYRIAAVEQLKIYANILNLPIEVVISPDELKDAISNFCTKDVILIDTAGRSQRDSEKIDELTEFLSANELIENYLVLSAGADSTTLDETVKNFGNLSLSGLIFTKLDESTKPGLMISQNYKTGIPIVYTTSGQKVPEDIEKASAKKIGTKLFKKDL